MLTLKNLRPLAVLLIVLFTCQKTSHAQAPSWNLKKQKNYQAFYQAADKQHIREYNKFILNGLQSVQKFFKASYPKKFDVYIHPTRNSLDITWQKDWNMPDFKSECWMVASGIATKLDMISPITWEKEACEHVYAETQKTQQLITHELVHVFHGQLNVSPDFSNTEGMDWFIEGLATYASGQCDSTRIAAVKRAINDEKIPQGLDNFWSGKLKYGLSGSVVMFIDQKYGREKLKSLVPLNKKVDLLLALNTTESDLLNEWKAYLKTM